MIKNKILYLYRSTSIKTRITFRWAMLICFFTLLVTISCLAVSHQIVVYKFQNHLKDMTNINASILLRSEETNLDDLIYLDSGIILLIYDKDLNLIKGNIPHAIRNNMNFLNNQMQIDYPWHTYDKHIITKNNEELWLRSVAQISRKGKIEMSLIEMLILTIPTFIFCTVVGGYLIIKNEISPIEKIIQSAEQISTGSDLSLRIKIEPESNTNNELFSLAKSINSMIDRLHISFEKERQFSSDASHELRTPLAVILAECDYVINEDTTEDDKDESLSVIYQQAIRMNKLLNYLIQIARSDERQIQLAYEEINLSDLLNMIIMDLSEIAKKEAITMHKNIQSNVIIEADENLIVRIFINLITNAIHYSHPEGNIYITLTETEDSIMCQIEDEGIGIAKEDIKKIFNRLYQVNKTRSNNNQNSMGLGLSMVQWCIERHKGKIWVESELNVGSKFIFVLPKKQTFIDKVEN